MKNILSKWGGLCVISGSLLMGISNVIVEAQLAQNSVLFSNAILWGHGLLTFGIIGFALSILSKNNQKRVLFSTMLFVFANVLLGTGIGALILEASGDLNKTIEELIAGNTSVSVNFLVAHFGYVIGLLVLLATALGHSDFSNSNLYLFIVGTFLIGIGIFTPGWIFATGFALSLIGGVWLGVEMIGSESAASTSRVTAEKA